MVRSACIIGAVLTGSLAAIPDPVSPDPNSPRPIEAVDTVFIEEMTWMEVRDAMQGGKDTVIIATGGVEQNGPYLATGKHNYVLKAMTDAIARKLGNALVAPIVVFVPEGDIDPPTVHMKYPGSISLTEETFQALLTDICRSFKTHGFKHVILIGDSGGNQSGMKAVAETLSAKWEGSASQVHFVPEFYDYPGVGKFLEDNGIKQTPEGLHDDFGITSIIMTVDPTAVRINQRIAAGKASINGVSLCPVENTIAWGHKLVEFRANATVKAIRKATK